MRHDGWDRRWGPRPGGRTQWDRTWGCPLPGAAPAEPAAVVIGHDISTGRPVTLGVAGRLNGVYLIGKNGTGKSSLIASLIAQDMRNRPGLVPA